MLYTIGHTNHTHEEFLKLLRQYDISYVLDVRSTPYSKFTSQFNKEVIAGFLEKNDINYWPMANYFGARPSEKSLYTNEGYLDFEKMRASDMYRKGQDSVLKGLLAGNQIALMCTEKDPIDCHRAIMVARGFSLQGIEVNHILPDGTLQSQKTLDARLLERYFPERNQISLFDDVSEKPEEELLTEAYRRRNREIGYHNDEL